MTAVPQQPTLRRLAYVYHPFSFGVFAIAEAARDVCRLIWVVDTTLDDTSAMLPLLRRLGPIVDVAELTVEQAATAIAAHEPDGVLTLKDSLMRWTAAVAQRLQLPFHSPEVAERFTDKYTQREALRDAGVPGPGFWTVPAAAAGPEWDALLAQVRFPAVLKPQRDSEGSRDTLRVTDVGQLRAGVLAAGGEPLVLEGYLEDRPGGGHPGFADYVSVETIVSRGRISHLAITGRFPPAPPFRESGFFIDAALSEGDREGALRAADEAVRALEVQTGCLHTEVKFTPDGPRVIELNGRIGGGVPEMLLDATGVALLPIALRIALGDSIVFDRPPEARGVAYLFYRHAPNWMRRITGVDGLSTLSAAVEVSEVMLNRGPGREVDWHEGNHGHVFSVRGVVADHEALLALDRRIAEVVTITGEPGGEGDAGTGAELAEPARSTGA